MRSTASALQPAISAIEDSFESKRRRELERHHHRFNDIDRHEVDRITRAITQKLLAVPLARLESIDPAGADLVRGIGHLQTLFSRPACDDNLADEAVERQRSPCESNGLSYGDGAPADDAPVDGAGMEDAAMENAPAARLAALQQLTQRQLELIGEDSNREACAYARSGREGTLLPYGRL